MNLIEFDEAIADRLSAWKPTLIITDNTPAETKGQAEYIRMTIEHGLGFEFETTGVFSVGGSTVMHSFILRFDVYGPINKGKDSFPGTRRTHELCQEVADQWQIQDFGNGVQTLAASIERVGEEKPHYHMACLIEGRRLETITKR